MAAHASQGVPRAQRNRDKHKTRLGRILRVLPDYLVEALVEARRLRQVAVGWCRPCRALG